MNNMPQNNLRKIKALIYILFFTFSCSSPLEELKSSGEVNLRSIVSDLDTVPSYYKIEGENDGGTLFDVTTVDTSIQIPGLTAGTWQISIHAYNEQDQLIAEGTGVLTVQPGGYSTMTITLYDITLTGSLDFSLLWNADLVWNESLTVQLENMEGDILALTYSQDSGSAEGLTENLPPGFYTLEVKLYDNLIQVMGAMELVQIKGGAVTDIDLDFSQINKPGQCVLMNQESFTISWDYDDTAADEYRIYYRTHGTYLWNYLGTTGSGSIQSFSIDQSLLSYGVYDLAVSTVIGEEESELHSSMDDTAIPATGWYIDWQGI
jgi:hypothetical protein